jgi:hypothetical protein
MMSPRVVLAVAALGLAASGCSQATGEVQGGTPLAVETASNGVCGPDAGSTWTDLYSCYFGPSGVASCAALGECHASAASQGAVDGFICGPTKETCFTGFTTWDVVDAGADAGDADITSAPAVVASRVVANLRSVVSPGALMPCNPVEETITGQTYVQCNSTAGSAYTFTQADVARIQAWITEGAQDN